MGLFSEWLKKEQGIDDPVGVEAAKKRVLGEAENPGPPPRGYRRGHPQFRSYDAALSAFQQASSNKPATQVQPTPQPVEPEKPKLNLTKTPEADTPILDGINWDNVTSRIKGKSKSAIARRERANNPRIREHVAKMMEARKTYRERSDQIGSANDVESAMVMLEQMGMSMDKNGKLSYSPSTSLHGTLAEGSKPFGVPNSRQYSGFFLEQMQAIKNNPELAQAMKNNDLAAIARLTFRNKFLNEDGGDDSWNVATDIYDNRSSAAFQRGMNNFGTPLPPGQGQAFSPLSPVIFELDDDGNYTGRNNIDDLWMSGDEDDLARYETHFGDNVTRARGIANLQKLLILGGVDMNTSLMEAMNIGNGTIDHLFGRSNANPEGYEKMRKESPLNTGASMGNVNQGKVRTGDDPSDLAGFADMYDVDDIEGWIADRLDSDIFDRILQNEDSISQFASAGDPDAGAGGSDLPDSLEGFLDLDGEQIKAIASDFSERSRPNGLDIRNFGKLAPEPRMKKGKERSEIGWLDNSWSGGRGFGYYDGLDPTRKALAGSFLKSSQFQDVKDNFLESQGITFDDDGNMIKNGKKLSVGAAKRIASQMRLAGQGFIGDTYMDDIRGLSTAYGLGRMSNDEYVQHHKDKSSKVLDLINNPDVKRNFESVVDNNLDEWLGKLNEWFDSERPGKSGRFPIRRTDSALIDGAKSATPTAIKAIMKSPRALEYLTKDERSALKELGF